MTRKYYRITVRRQAPYAKDNKPYYYKEDVYAYSEDGAYRSFLRYYKNSYGCVYPCSIKEISKEEFIGHHEISDYYNQ